MTLPATFSIGVCSNGPVLLSGADDMEHKFVLSIADYERNKHRTAIACKTTSRNHEKVFPGEFLVDDFFGRGKSKIQPYNIVRMPDTDVVMHKYIGDLDREHLPSFEKGLRIAIQRGFLQPHEVIRVADSWAHIFDI